MKGHVYAGLDRQLPHVAKRDFLSSFFAAVATHEELLGYIDIKVSQLERSKAANQMLKVAGVESYQLTYTNAVDFEAKAIEGYAKKQSGQNYKVRPASGLNNMTLVP